MKKIVTAAAIVLLSMVVLLSVVPFLFRGKINALIKEQINENLNARADYRDFGLDLFTAFPDFKFTLRDFSLVGVNEFERDTLLSFKSLKIRLDLLSVLKMENIKIKSIVIDRPSVYALVLPNGKANWDIMKPSSDTLQSQEDTSETKFSLSLKKFEITGANVVYDDRQSKIYTSLQNFNLLLRGDFTQDFTAVNILSSVDFANVMMDGIRYLRDASLKMDITADADLKNSLYTLKENSFSLNDLVLGWNGTVAMKGNDIVVDMTYKTKKTDFKSFLSLVPAVYMKDFETVKTAGNLQLEGYVRGTYNDKKMPNVGLTLAVDKGMFRYPELPKPVENIMINARIFFDGTQNDNTTVDVDKFHFEMGGNPFDVVLNLKTPISDPAVNMRCKGKIDFSSLKDVIPMEGITLKGILTADIDMMGQMSMIEKEKYEEFKANGLLRLEKFEYSAPDVPKGTLVNKMELLFSPQEVKLTAFDAVIGKSDLRMTGNLQNFIPYVLKGQTVRGGLVLESNLLDLNQLMQESATSSSQAPADTAPMTLFEVPKNISFVVKTSIGQVFYDKLLIKNLSGTLKIDEGKVLLQRLFMNLLEGSMTMDCEYNTQDLTQPFVDMALDMKDFDIPSAFMAFNTVKQLAPVAEHARGRFSMGIKFRSLLDRHMNPVLKTFTGQGRFSSKNVEIVNSKTFARIAEAMQYDGVRNVRLENVAFDFSIKEGRVYVDPFETKVGKTKMNISGENGLDQTLNYKIRMAVPRSELGAAANKVVSSLAESAAAAGITIKPGENVNFALRVGNMISDPRVTVELLPEYSSKDIKDQVKTQLASTVNEARAKAKEAVNEKAQKILADAQKEADQIKAQAAQLAEAARKEAYVNADRIEKEASGKPKFARDAAKKIADKTRKEGDEKAQNIILEGDRKAEAVMQKARAEAEKIK